MNLFTNPWFWFSLVQFPFTVSFIWGLIKVLKGEGLE